MATSADVLAGLAPWSVDASDCLAWLRTLPAGCVQSCVTSPPYYGLRDYGPAGQIGLEDTPDAYVGRLVEVFREMRRVLRPDGTCWLNIGDSYNAYNGNRGRSTSFQSATEDAGPLLPAGHGLTVKGLKAKDLLMVPARVAIALRDDGWYLRSEIVWSKKSPMPQSVRDRPTTSHEMIYLLTKGSRYFYDQEAERVESVRPGDVQKFGKRSAPDSITPTDPRYRNGAEQWGRTVECADGRNLWSVWDDLSPTPYPGAHFATFPEAIPRRCLRLGSSLKGCCPACGSPWSRQVDRQKRTRQCRNDYTKRTGEEGTGNSCANSVAGVSVTTTGWAPSCSCPPHEPVPCVVMDPFTGSGTTGAVARDLGMRFIGVDLNPEYAEMARRRIGQANPMLDACDVARLTQPSTADLFPD